MARIVDITDKLSFDESPSLQIKGKAIGVNADAPSVLKLMALSANAGDNTSADDIIKMYDLLFPDASKKVLDSLKLSFADLNIVIGEALALITGSADTP